MKIFKNEWFVWLIYSIGATVLLIPYTGISLKTITGGILIGFFAGILNAIKDKLE